MSNPFRYDYNSTSDATDFKVADPEGALNRSVPIASEASGLLTFSTQTFWEHLKSTFGIMLDTIPGVGSWNLGLEMNPNVVTRENRILFKLSVVVDDRKYSMADVEARVLERRWYFRDQVSSAFRETWGKTAQFVYEYNMLIEFAGLNSSELKRIIVTESGGVQVQIEPKLEPKKPIERVDADEPGADGETKRVAAKRKLLMED